MNKVVEKWDEILQIVKTEHDLSDVSFNTWLKPLTVYEVVDNVVTIIVPSEQVGLNYISKKYKLPLQVTISEVTGMENCDINFILPEDVPKKEEVSPKAQSQDARCEEAHLNPKYTFDTFVVGSNNKFAQAAALAVAESPGDTYNPLFIYGGAGLGKTHLMHSIAHFIIDHDENSKVLYVTSEEFTNELIETIRNGNNSAMTKFREKYRNIDVLLVDDIQFIIGKESTQEEFFHTFNSLHSAKKQIIISSDKPPKDMEILEERFRSRFEWGLIADITLPDYETRMAILHKKEEMDGYDINEEVIKYIANNIKSNIRELEGAINKVMAFAKLEKKEVTLELAEQALKDIISPDEKKVITPDYIISMVAEHFDVTVDDLCGNKRNSKIVTPRQIAMYLCREIISTPLKSIGKCLGNRDHTTIMHGIDKIEKEINNDENLKNTIETLKKKINPQADKIVSICRALDMSLVDLLCDEETVEPAAQIDCLTNENYMIELFRQSDAESKRRIISYIELLEVCKQINNACQSRKRQRNVSIIQDIDGNNIVVINDIRFKGKRSINWREVRAYLKEYVGDFYMVASTGDVIYIGADLPNEYSGSKYTHSIKGTNAKAKANATQGIPEMIEIAVALS